MYINYVDFFEDLAEQVTPEVAEKLKSDPVTKNVFIEDMKQAFAEKKDYIMILSDQASDGLPTKFNFMEYVS